MLMDKLIAFARAAGDRDRRAGVRTTEADLLRSMRGYARAFRIAHKDQTQPLAPLFVQAAIAAYDEACRPQRFQRAN